MIFRLLYLTLLCSFISFSTQAQYKEGILVDNKGKAWPGYIFVHGKNKVSFKVNKKDKAEVLGTDKVNSFFIQQDSFVTIQYKNLVREIDFDGFEKTLLRNSKTFLCRIEFWPTKNNGKDDKYPGLSKHFVTTRLKNNDYNSHMYITKHDDLIVELSETNFYVLMPKIVFDHEALVNRINSKELSFSNLRQIIKEYEEWQISQKKPSPPAN